MGGWIAEPCNLNWSPRDKLDVANGSPCPAATGGPSRPSCRGVEALKSAEGVATSWILPCPKKGTPSPHQHCHQQHQSQNSSSMSNAALLSLAS